MGDKSTDDLNNISAYINAVFIFGGAFGGFLLGIISDKAGRKKAVILSIACYGVFTILTGYTPVWWGVVICRFFSGFGLGGVLVTTTTIMMEVWPEKNTRLIHWLFIHCHSNRNFFGWIDRLFCFLVAAGILNRDCSGNDCRQLGVPFKRVCEMAT